MARENKKGKRMTLPKTHKDIEKIVEEIEEQGEHEHHHHHHGHGDIDEIIAIVELLIDSLNVKMKDLEDRVALQSKEITRLYKILSLILRYLAIPDKEEKSRVIQEAVKILES